LRVTPKLGTPRLSKDLWRCLRSSLVDCFCPTSFSFLSTSLSSSSCSTSSVSGMIEAISGLEAFTASLQPFFGANSLLRIYRLRNGTPVGSNDGRIAKLQPAEAKLSIGQEVRVCYGQSAPYDLPSKGILQDSGSSQLQFESVCT